MNKNLRASEDQLTERIARAFASRESAEPDAMFVASRIEAQLAARAPQTSPGKSFARHGGRIFAAGVVTSALAVAGAGAAAAANPYSDLARGVENLAQAVGVDWSAMPEGYTREQYDAFWGANHTVDDVLRLSALWHSDATATKARAGQMILDGQPLPTATSTDPVTPAPAPAPVTPVPVTPAPDLVYTQEHFEALEAAGYSFYDEMMLSELWAVELDQAKARAGQMLLDGEVLPILPGAGDVLAEPGELAYGAYWDAGYSQEDAEALAALWNSDVYVTKVRAGQMLLDGLPLPFAPGGAEGYVGQG
ncbi:hypothetical protein [Sanguibacter sp. 25GB23B1]|uniref:hypothetical protein n=1 Tax=unclassified Sanguibacter TaxID=2645534 RepID=UPI0032AF022E